MSTQTGASAGNGAAGSEEAVTRIFLKQTLDIWQAEDLQHELSAALSADIPVIINGELVERIDAAALQLLTGFFLAMEKAGIGCHWDSVSEPLQRAISCCGLCSQLGQKN